MTKRQTRLLSGNKNLKKQEETEVDVRLSQRRRTSFGLKVGRPLHFRQHSVCLPNVGSSRDIRRRHLGSCRRAELLKKILLTMLLMISIEFVRADFRLS